VPGLGDHWQLREGRHTYTSVGSHNGLPVVVLADSLGHINPNVTLRTYRKQLAPAHPATGAVMDQVWTVDRVYPPGVPGAE
jgi:integrase